MTPKTKAKIKGIVKSYKNMFPEEYQAVVSYLENIRDNNDDDFGTMQGSVAIERRLFEIPETLDSMFVKYLSEEELQEWRPSEGEKQKKNARWFAKTFPEFQGGKKL